MLSKKNLDDADILGILLGIEIESIPCQIQLENFAISYAASQGLSSVYDKGFLKLFFKIHMHDGGEARHLEEAYRILEILKDKEKINKAERIADEITDFFKMWRLSYAEKLDYKKAGNF